MSLVARVIATMAVAFVMLPGLYANDAAKPKAKAKKPAASIVAPVVTETKGPSNTTKSLFAPFSTISQSRSETHGGQAGAMDGSGESGSYPKVEWFLGYSFWRAMPTAASNRMGYLHGGSTSVAYNFNKYVGLVADFGGYDNSNLTLFSPTGSRTLDSNGSAYTYVFGPRFSYRGYGRFTPFFQALFGGAHASPVTVSGCSGNPGCTPLGSDNAFATMLGAGFDIRISDHVALRPFQGDFLLTHFKDPFSAGGQGRGWQENVRFSTGIVFRFGGHRHAASSPPSVPMAATCSAGKETVFAGSGEIIGVRADASNPDNNPLTYSWSASEGTVDGTGPAVRWDSSDKQPGTYTIKARVGNGQGGAAACAVNIRVEPRPNRPPTMSCSADRTTVTVGEPVEITATASDPDNDPLSFSWNASGGKIEGSGSSVTFPTADLSPGSYAISGRVDDGRTGTAACTVNVGVEAAPLPPEAKQLEARLSLHSIYFATARPTAANPAGGLVKSQQEVLLSLARDFNRYLTFNPNAHLILEGHADRRGSSEFNKDLTERRVERTKGFLVEHGVPAANIETRSLGEQQNLTAAQVKQLVEQNPDLTNAERQRIESNLPMIVWANNRRVDISLNTTGQQSVRRYPFNAKDSLTLLSTKAGKRSEGMRPQARKKTTKP
ncbi:MAG TPA: OmpA family protein [Patescibacteria group bacterium]|nr:OmpA family protein [Patescibacteria group bacterium]